MTQLTHAEYCRNREAQKTATFHYKPQGGSFYTLFGKMYSWEEFDRTFPIEDVQLITIWQKRHNKGVITNKNNFKNL